MKMFQNPKNSHNFHELDLPSSETNTFFNFNVGIFFSQGDS